jgi:hypothetical protein
MRACPLSSRRQSGTIRHRPDPPTGSGVQDRGADRDACDGRGSRRSRSRAKEVALGPRDGRSAGALGPRRREVGVTDPIPRDRLTSRGASDALCAQALGAGIRTGEHHDDGADWHWWARSAATGGPLLDHARRPAFESVVDTLNDCRTPRTTLLADGLLASLHSRQPAPADGIFPTRRDRNAAPLAARFGRRGCG